MLVTFATAFVTVSSPVILSSISLLTGVFGKFTNFWHLDQNFNYCTIRISTQSSSHYFKVHETLINHY